MCQSCSDNPHKLIGPQIPLSPDVALVELPPPKIMAKHSPIESEEEAEKLVKCDSCGEEHTADDLRTSHDEETLCDDCSISCEKCGDIYRMDSDDIGSARRDGYPRHEAHKECRCDDCSIKCEDCNERIYDHAGAQNDSEEPICSKCSHNYTTCEECNDMVPNNSSYYDDVDQRSLCHRCMREVESSRGSDSDSDSDSGELIRDYNYRPAPVFYAANEERINLRTTYFGLEIEAEGGKRSSAVSECGLSELPEFYAKHDGSLKDGFEIVSHPATLAYWQAHPLAFMDKLRKMGYRSYDTDTCGLHVHVSKTALSPSQRAKLLLWAKINHNFILYVSRRPTRSKLEEWASVDDKGTGHLIAKAKGESSQEHDERYTAINMLPAKTIEFRIFRGTLNAQSIKRNINLVACIVQWVKTAQLSALHWRHLVKWIESLDGRKFIGKANAAELVTWLDGYRGGVSPQMLNEERTAA